MKNYILPALKWYGISAGYKLMILSLGYLNNSFIDTFSGKLYFIHPIIYLGCILMGLRAIHKKTGKIKFWKALGTLSMLYVMFYIISVLIKYQIASPFKMSLAQMEAMNNLVYMLAIDNLAYMLAPIALYIFVLLRIGRWYAFEKADIPGWYSFIPIVSGFQAMRLAGKSPAYFLWWLIPIMNIYTSITWAVETSKKFGKTGGFAAGLFFFTSINLARLGYDDSVFKGATQNDSSLQV